MKTIMVLYEEKLWKQMNVNKMGYEWIANGRQLSINGQLALAIFLYVTDIVMPIYSRLSKQSFFNLQLYKFLFQNCLEVIEREKLRPLIAQGTAILLFMHASPDSFFKQNKAILWMVKTNL